MHRLFLPMNRPVQHVVKLKLVLYSLNMTVMRQECNRFDLLVWKVMLNDLPSKGQRKNEKKATRKYNLIWFCSWLAHMTCLWYARKVHHLYWTTICRDKLLICAFAALNLPGKVLFFLIELKDSLWFYMQRLICLISTGVRSKLWAE